MLLQPAMPKVPTSGTASDSRRNANVCHNNGRQSRLGPIEAFFVIHASIIGANYRHP